MSDGWAYAIPASTVATTREQGALMSERDRDIETIINQALSDIADLQSQITVMRARVTALEAPNG